MTARSPDPDSIPTTTPTGLWRRLGRAWRSTATGFCFLWYASLAWVAGITVLPVLCLGPGSRAARRARVRRVVGWSFRLLLGVIALLRVGHVEVEGRQWLAQAKGKLLVANHPMYLDVVALVGLLPQADCVVKQAMWQNRFYRRFVEVIGYVGNADTVGVMHECVARIKQGRNVILFPEGTRSTPGQPLHFYRGAAQVAARSGCDILPVVIECRPLALGKHQAWHEVGDRPWTLRIRVLPPRSVSSLGATPDMPHGVAARRVNRRLKKLFNEALGEFQAADETPGTHAATLHGGTA